MVGITSRLSPMFGIYWCNTEDANNNTVKRQWPTNYSGQKELNIKQKALWITATTSPSSIPQSDLQKCVA